MSENTQVVTQNTGAVVQKPKTFDMALMEKLDSVNDALPKDFNNRDSCRYSRTDPRQPEAYGV